MLRFFLGLISPCMLLKKCFSGRLRWAAFTLEFDPALASAHRADAFLRRMEAQEILEP